MPHEPRRPDPRPVQVNETRIVAVGVALWVLALVVLAVFFRVDLRRHHAMWWLLACVVGISLGPSGLRFVSRRDRSGGCPGTTAGALVSPCGAPQLQNPRRADEQHQRGTGDRRDQQ